MTIEQGMNKLAEVLGESSSFCITVSVWQHGHDKTNPRQIEYRVYDAARDKAFHSSSVEASVMECLNNRNSEFAQDADEALKGVA